jgi:hypothetical protein
VVPREISTVFRLFWFRDEGLFCVLMYLYKNIYDKWKGGLKKWKIIKNMQEVTLCRQ